MELIHFNDLIDDNKNRNCNLSYVGVGRGGSNTEFVILERPLNVSCWYTAIHSDRDTVTGVVGGIPRD